MKFQKYNNIAKKLQAIFIKLNNYDEEMLAMKANINEEIAKNFKAENVQKMVNKQYEDLGSDIYLLYLVYYNFLDIQQIKNLTIEKIEFFNYGEIVALLEVCEEISEDYLFQTELEQMQRDCDILSDVIKLNQDPNTHLDCAADQNFKNISDDSFDSDYLQEEGHDDATENLGEGGFLC